MRPIARVASNWSAIPCERRRNTQVQLPLPSAAATAQRQRGATNDLCRPPNCRTEIRERPYRPTLSCYHNEVDFPAR